MAAVSAGVFPVWENAFKIGKAGAASEEDDMVSIAECTTFSPTFDVGEETWNSMEDQGWVNGLVTSNRITLAISAKRSIGDPGNDYVAGLVAVMGQSAQSRFEWDFPDGSKLEFACNVVVTNNSGGDSTNVGALEFEVRSCKKPTYTPKASV